MSTSDFTLCQQKPTSIALQCRLLSALVHIRRAAHRLLLRPFTVTCAIIRGLSGKAPSWPGLRLHERGTSEPARLTVMRFLPLRQPNTRMPPTLSCAASLEGHPPAEVGLSKRSQAWLSRCSARRAGCLRGATMPTIARVTLNVYHLELVETLPAMQVVNL